MKLNFPETYPEPKIVVKEQKKLIFDIVRQQFFPLTPEEYVRQYAIIHIVHKFGWSVKLLAVEKNVASGNQILRTDLLAFDKNGEVAILVECKAPHIKIDDKVLLQAANYYKQIDCKHIWLTNGLEHLWLRKGSLGFEKIDEFEID